MHCVEVNNTFFKQFEADLENALRKRGKRRDTAIADLVLCVKSHCNSLVNQLITAETERLIHANTEIRALKQQNDELMLWKKRCLRRIEKMERATEKKD